jgi:hypothetical protein
MSILDEVYTQSPWRVFKSPSLLFTGFYWSDIKYSICAYFNPRQKWLTKTIPNRWCDKTSLIPHLLFTCLVHYVEEEKGLQDDYDYSEDLKAGFVSQEYVDSVLTTDRELREVYNYIKTERPGLELHLEVSYPTPKEPNTEFFTQGDDGHYTMKSCEELYGMSYAKAYAKVRSIETKLEKKDAWAMKTIIKHYQKMWT